MKKLRLFCIFLIVFISISRDLNANIFEDKNNKFNNSKFFLNYLSGIISFNKNDIEKSNKYFETIKDLGLYHSEFNYKYVENLVNKGKIDEAYSFIQNLGQDYYHLYPFNLVMFVHDFKNHKYNKIKDYLIVSNKNNLDSLQLELYLDLNLWLKLATNSSDDNKNFFKDNLGSNSNFKNIFFVQKILINLFLNNEIQINNDFNEISINKNFRRYNFFYLKYFLEKNNKEKIEEVISKNNLNYSDNLLFRQLFVDIKSNDYSIIEKFYNRSDLNDGLAELFYLFGAIYKDQNQIGTSTFYLNLSDYLNPNFTSNKILGIEDHLLLNDNNKSKIELSKIQDLGSEFYWYANILKIKFLSDKQIKNQISVLDNYLKIQDKKNLFLSEKYFELANILKNINNYSKSIDYYKKSILFENEKYNDWMVYYNMGISYERSSNWADSEKFFSIALKKSPKQPEVLNYLAYSWLERNINIDKALSMLTEAVEISKGEGYIVDSLGWAYYLSKDYLKAEETLKIAYEKEPSEAVIYDHYGDVLWKNGKEIQARNIWQNAVKLKSIENNLKNSINNKIIFGLDDKSNNKS